MPLTPKGSEILKAMQSSKGKGGYGKKKGEQVFYASANKGTIKGVHEKKKPSRLALAIVKRSKQMR